MNWPVIGGVRLTAWRMVFLALVAVDAVLFTRASYSAVGLALVLVGWGFIIGFRERRRLMWLVRNRLIVTYVFIAVVPLALILALIFVAGYLVMGQTSAYLIGTALDRRSLEIERASRLLAAESPEDRLSTARQLTATGLLDFEAVVTGDSEFRYPAESRLQMPAAGWNDYTGLVYRHGRHYLMSLVKRGRNQALILRSLTRQDQANLVRGLGTVMLPIPPYEPLEDSKGRVFRVGNEDVNYGAPAGVVTPAYNPLDLELTWLPPIQVAGWDRPNSETLIQAVLVTRPSALFEITSRSDPYGAEGYLYAFYGLAALLGIAWILSIYIGVTMTRRLTGAVHDLYEGTMHIAEGDFVHRIGASGRDQLTSSAVHSTACRNNLVSSSP